MGSYSSAFKEQSASRAAENLSNLIPPKNAVPLLLTSPYANPPIDFGKDGWLSQNPDCDFATHELITNNFVDIFLSRLQGVGVTVLPSEHYRYKIDLDRKANSLNRGYCDRALSFVPDDDDIYAANGVGVVWLRTPGDTETPLYVGDNQPFAKDIDQLLQYHDFYHKSVDRYMSAQMEKFGVCFHMSVQPFSEAEAVMLGADPENIPPFVLCDGNGKTSSFEFIDKLAHTISGKGYGLLRNQIFPTGELTSRHSSPSTNAHSVQLKIFEGLYFDPETCEKTRGYAKFSKDIHAILSTMADFARNNIRKPQASAEIKQFENKASAQKQSLNIVPKPDGLQ